MSENANVLNSAPQHNSLSSNDRNNVAPSISSWAPPYYIVVGTVCTSAQNSISFITAFSHKHSAAFTVIIAATTYPAIIVGLWLSTLPTSLNIASKTVCWVVFFLSFFPPTRILPSKISCYFYPSNDSHAILTEVWSMFWVRFTCLGFMLSLMSIGLMLMFKS
ncbi:hypothetical protein EV421DRAFT_1896334 [Armillaria borealis]|uniref:Uncharacterized protein n=1 Tax=Armillaria borealis TaxID=47425 RepID=A0AA39N165_9AGAR|nr:hypothetical protein EV421DRAFT_1896334 [Armillaria borealis]